MKTCKQTASMVAAATDEAHSKSAAKSDAIQSRKGKKAKGKLAVKSNGTEKPKTHAVSDVTRGFAVMSVAEEIPELEVLALYSYQNAFWMNNYPGVYDRPSVDAIRKEADKNWKFFNDSDKAPYIAKARVNRIIIARVNEFKKTLKLTRLMTNKMMNLKM
ncbi:DNA-binding protein MNB1B-like [Lolium rigidum]|uniref:DNA-binding protein MNB1B-like n=1 Tax=Lolium rigidum TaxID=89674 RepID=UPI001F5C5DB3|nr:DNA-binding protein MNB1B-like [Lolium rigidum]